MLIFRTPIHSPGAKSHPAGSPSGVGHHLNGRILRAGLFLSPGVRYRFEQMPPNSTIGALPLWY